MASVTAENIASDPPMGATLVDGGATFRVWAPRAQEVYLVGSFEDEEVWEIRPDHRLNRGFDGHWTGFRSSVREGNTYKFWIVGEGSSGYKRDPYARELSSTPPYPRSNCVLRDPHRYGWRATGWRPPAFTDLIVYQLHIGTFTGTSSSHRVGLFLDVIARMDYLVDLGVTALQLLPIAEFSSPRSLGYDGSDIFSPEMDYTVEGSEAHSYLGDVNRQLARFNAPLATQDEIAVPINQLKLLIDICHLNGIAVLLDVVYNHAGGQIVGHAESLYFFDRAAGTSRDQSLYFMDRDHTGPVFAFWNEQVRQFLIDNAVFYINEYRIDGLRYDQTSVIDAESRGHGWLFLQHCTSTVRSVDSSVCQVAEYWPINSAVTQSAYIGGAGFDAAWNDGFREAVRHAITTASAGADALVDLNWVARELASPIYDDWRGFNCLESHDEVYRGREPRVAWLADPSNRRSWYARSRSRVGAALLLAAPGVPMLFMGQEILEDKNWSDDPGNHPNTLVWWEGLSEGEKPMVDMHRCVRDLIKLRRSHDSLRYGRTRVFHVDLMNRVIAFHRWIESRATDIVVVASLRDETHHGYRLGLPRAGAWREAFNTDVYDNWVNPVVSGNGGKIEATAWAQHGFSHSAEIVIPANSVVVLEPT